MTGCPAESSTGWLLESSSGASPPVKVNFTVETLHPVALVRQEAQAHAEAEEMSTVGERSNVVQLRGGLDVAVVRRGGAAAIERAEYVYGRVRGIRSGGIAPSRKLEVSFVDG